MEEKDLIAEIEAEEIDPQEIRINQLLDIMNASYHAHLLRESLSDFHSNDVAQVLPLISKDLRLRLYAVLSNDELSDIFAYLDNPSEFIEEMSGEKVADIIEEMASDDAVDLLEELDEDKQKGILELLDDETARDVELIAAYDEELIGSMMTNDFVCICQSESVPKTMRKVISDAGEKDNISTIFVTDNDGFYKGAIPLRDLVIARKQTPLEDIIITSFPFVYASDQIKDNLQAIKEYAEPTLPVLDDDNRLIGALTSADLIEAVDEELTEDYAKLAGLSEEALEDAVEKKQIFSGALKRLPWLIVLLILDLFIGAYIGIFEAVVIGLPFLVSFQQLVAGLSGNTGTQTLAMTVQLLADNSVTKKEKSSFLFKEIRVGFLIGLATGIISLILVTLYSYLVNSDLLFITHLKMGLTVGVAMLISASVSAMTGCLIPITLHKLGADPAVASGPLITTLNDLIAITVYYGIALIALL